MRAEMLKLAEPMHKQMYPQHTDHTDLSEPERQNLIIGEVLRKISDDHPDRDHLQTAIERRSGQYQRLHSPEENCFTQRS